MFRGAFVAYLDNIGFRADGRAKKDGQKPPKVVDATFRLEPLSPDAVEELGAEIAAAVLHDGKMWGPMRSANFSLPSQTYQVVFNPEAKDEGIETLALENGKVKGITIRRDKESDGLVGVFTVTCDLPVPKHLALLIDWTNDQHQLRFDIVQPNMITEAEREAADELPTPRLSRRKRAAAPPPAEDSTASEAVQ